MRWCALLKAADVSKSVNNNERQQKCQERIQEKNIETNEIMCSHTIARIGLVQ